LDDPGGLAVSLKLSAAIRRTDATSANVGDALSYLQSQDGAMQEASSILDRMSYLASLAAGTANTNANALYDAEYTELLTELTSMTAEEFNDIPLFSNNSTVLVVRTSENASQTVGITQVDLGGILAGLNAGDLANTTQANNTVASLETTIQALGVLLATNGAQQSRLTFAQDILKVNRLNLEAAKSQIMDVDIAKESTEYAKHSILAEAGVAMLAQANTVSGRALKLLEFN
jgi:flagellin